MGFVTRTAVVASVVAMVALPAVAQQAQRIRHVDIQGTQRIEIETVKSYMAIAEGDPYDAERVDRSLKTLFNTGLFTDVTIRQEGETLVVRVVENPIINRLAFEGNQRLKEEQLQSETQLRPRTVYTRTKVLSDVQRILDLYRREGRFAATVEPKVIQLEQNRVDLVYEINEGPATYVKKINFVGNRFYSESKLSEILLTKEERWYRFLSSSDTYDPDRLTYDRELLRRFYLKHGFADFRVNSAIAELTPNREGFFITLTIDEGDRYKFGESTIKSSLKDFNADELKPIIVSEPGQWYNGDEVESTVQHLTDALGSRGYAFVEVRPQVKRNRETKTVEITYDIQEGPRVYVERIEITGNVRTLDKVVRREFTLVEGDAFNTAKLRRSQQRLKDLDFFEKVDVTNVPSESAPDRTIIKVDLREKSTGELTFGVGWSSSAGPLIETSLRERNLLGRGQDMRLSGGLGLKMTNAQLSFTEPYLFDRRLVGGFDVFAIQRRLQSESGYDSDTIGAALRTGYHISDSLRQDWKYQAKQDTVTNVASGTSAFVQQQAGTSLQSLIGQSLLYDRRDSKVDPTDGYYLRLGNEYAGLGGDQYFIRNTVGGAEYYPIAEKVIATISGNFGIITGLNDTPVRITERYYLGGDSVRGFANAGIGPRDANTGDALGGLWQYYGSAEVKFPVGLPEEYGVAGEVFSDMGAVGNTDPSLGSTAINQASSTRIAVGVGMSWKSPMGPVAVDLGFPVKKEPFDKTQIFHFNFGTRF
jgi:outer membrane protein insertion porin family